ncbi:hypothetical protein PTTG_25322 [Puccinia triticina 1-1 BBBD Race 1]|uniref:Uncharacterized protein n=2 Tax=Puccinia triticina TaxID=208348 RepID=A0A180H2L4_PUCT1|nr:uncharacterized protein PtA15_1A515 [Puccinia triticina]XP_053023166.1 uncharacterized protein PtA15_8A516 [Puccinia triticina]OAV99245.1 hypothetical protein PTTG_25322 [Puccinia triticina 1-1 BBBD Race 1]WAQ81176.1 hypothetical protein PtA15_1A515 [Puccinia triticina]WAQ87611.1 hypothetical protein PtA15_8A516 [Puccinia triticina]WAR52072.1 hypothetical protein PtB15_1B511 [Puccinia triticina]WAR57462.1 hypothetical protein PtB15_8B511 [Puccinia triticina]
MNNSPAQVIAMRRGNPVGFPGNSHDHPYIIDGPQINNRSSNSFPGNSHDHPYIIGQTHVYCIDATYPGSPRSHVLEGNNPARKAVKKENREDEKPFSSDGGFVVFHRLSSQTPPRNLPELDKNHKAPESSTKA